MSNQKIITRIRNVALFTATSLIIFAQCDDDESDVDVMEENAECEIGCSVDYLGDMDTCEDDTSNCQYDCLSINDYDCLLDCEGCADEIVADAYTCFDGCTCVGAYNSCESECDDDDEVCDSECGSEYMDCAGSPSTYPCVNTCLLLRSNCYSGCEDNSDGVVAAYLVCTGDCSTASEECVLSCLTEP